MAFAILKMTYVSQQYLLFITYVVMNIPAVVELFLCQIRFRSLSRIFADRYMAVYLRHVSVSLYVNCFDSNSLPLNTCARHFVLAKIFVVSAVPVWLLINCLCLGFIH